MMRSHHLIKHDPARRRLLTGALAGVATLVLAQMSPLLVAEASAQAAAAQRIADHFSAVRTMTGEFVQFGPSGEQTGGKFFLERPGKIRFNYEAPSDFRMIADGKSVVFMNARMNTADLYSLSQTPLKMFLDDRIDLSGGKLKGVKEDPDLTTLTLEDKSVFGNARLQLMFDPQSLELRQWTITDAQGKDTTVMIFNVQEGVAFDKSVFEINYNRVREMNQGQSGR